MRELIIEEIKMYGWLDYNYSCGSGIIKFSSYAAYLQSLSDSELLRTYSRIVIAESALD